MTALNAGGLSLACLTSTVPRETANGTPLLLLYRAIAQHATTLDEVEWLLRGTRRTIGNNLTVTSGPANDARSFEFTMSRVSTIPTVDGLVAATNHFQHPAMAELQEGWVVPSSEARLARLQGQLRGGRHGIAEAQAALTDCCPTDSAGRRLGVPEQPRHDLQLDRGSGGAEAVGPRLRPPGPWLGRPGPRRVADGGPLRRLTAATLEHPFRVQAREPMALPTQRESWPRRVVRNPRILGGEPTLEGTRVPVQDDRRGDSIHRAD